MYNCIKYFGILTVNNLKEVLKKSEDQLVVLAFTAEWSGASHILEMYLSDLATELSGQVFILKMEIDDPGAKELMLFNIDELPTTLLLDKQVVKERWVGLKSKAKIRQLIQSNI
jgi:thioredoxin-like negative regulator of GroEL